MLGSSPDDLQYFPKVGFTKMSSMSSNKISCYTSILSIAQIRTKCSMFEDTDCESFLSVAPAIQIYTRTMKRALHMQLFFALALIFRFSTVLTVASVVD
ncbi:MAG: hypothetical protein ACTSQ2_11635 [Candidatus Heimdallarchaeaceae archaeon]